MSLLRSLTGAMAGAVLWAEVAIADRSEEFATLMEAIRLADTVAIMRDEGLVYGSTLITDMMIDADTPGWRIRVGQIYDETRMLEALTSGLEAELQDLDLEPVLAFFASDLGAEIIALELAAREVFSEEQAELDARDRFEDLTDNDDPLVEQITTMIEDSDLVNFNVMGIMNSNMMLYRGLSDGGAIELGEDDILRDVWASEPSVREESTGWLQGYFLTCYETLEPEELETYAAFWRTGEGRAFNAALFAVFDQMYEDLSYLLGRAAAEQLKSEEL
ncbi:MAG: DUF2059 domain-containing protein [Pseudomonadota bacterium]